MPQFVVAIHHQDDFDPSKEDQAVIADIHALNAEMEAAGVRKLACGLGPATSLRASGNGDISITDGPYLETKEHIGGFWILETADLEDALAWGRKALAACRAPVEVRPMFFRPSGDA